MWFVLWGLLTLLATAVPGFGVLVVLVLALVPLAVLVLAVFAIANGVTVIGAEGLSRATALSLVAGIALLVLPAVALGLVLTRHPVGIVAAAILFFVCSYAGVVFVSFLAYSLVYGRMNHRVRPARPVVLGSRVIDGRVPPLLASRLYRALQLYRTYGATGPAPLLIPTGGKGDDETRSEGAAMAEYLLAHGADPADVRPEVQARNTRENLVLSAAVAGGGPPGPGARRDEQLPRAADGGPGPAGGQRHPGGGVADGALLRPQRVPAGVRGRRRGAPTAAPAARRPVRRADRHRVHRSSTSTPSSPGADPAARHPL